MIRFLLAWTLLLAASACQAHDPRQVWRLTWSVEVLERFHNPLAGTLLALPAKVTGREIWWVGPDDVVIESQGVISRQQKGMAKSWILGDKGWVYTLDMT